MTGLPSIHVYKLTPGSPRVTLEFWIAGREDLKESYQVDPRLAARIRSLLEVAMAAAATAIDSKLRDLPILVEPEVRPL